MEKQIMKILIMTKININEINRIKLIVAKLEIIKLTLRK
jgi:hypothetical protein